MVGTGVVVVQEARTRSLAAACMVSFDLVVFLKRRTNGTKCFARSVIRHSTIGRVLFYDGLTAQSLESIPHSIFTAERQL